MISGHKPRGYEFSLDFVTIYVTLVTKIVTKEDI
jgi:hypothetical protein